MSSWFHGDRVFKQRWPALLAIAAGGAVLLVCGGWIVLVPVGQTAGETAGARAAEKKTTLTHAERVVLTAEQMHKARYRAAPDDSLETQMRNAVSGEHSLSS